VVIEAMAASRPVIGSNIPGIRECIVQSGGGILFNDGDSEALAEAMRSLSCNTKKVHDLGLNGKNWVLSQALTWENTAFKYILLIQKILKI